MKGDWKVFESLLAFRVVNALIVRTYFNPDEYWQSLEVAHSLVFGYGHLTWEWKERIRGFSHPLIFAFAYELLKITGLDTPLAIIYVPRIIQAFFSALADFSLYNLSRKISGAEVAHCTLWCSIFSWFTFYCGVRTLSNSLESQLTIIALQFWELPTMPIINGNPSLNRAIAVIISSLSIIIRPTAALFWIPVVLLHLSLIGSFKRILKVIFFEILPLGLVILLIGTIVDSLFYRTFTFVPFNFVYHNIFKNIADLYGTHSWHWYFSQGFPAMLGSFTPLFIIGIFQRRTPKVIGWLIAWNLISYSFLAHKEFRFVFPSFLISMFYCGNAYYSFWTTRTRHLKLLRSCIVVVVGIQILTASYFSLYHQRGPIDVMNFLRETKSPPATNVDFLTPCHSTPWFSFIHFKGINEINNPISKHLNMTFLDCSPPDNLKQPHLMDQADQFKSNPYKFTTDWISNKQHRKPSHIVTFSKYVPQLSKILSTISMNVCARFTNNPFEDNQIVVFCRK